MKEAKISEAQIFALLKKGESGIAVDEICRKYGIGHSTYYKYKVKYGGMEIVRFKKAKNARRKPSFKAYVRWIKSGS